MLLSMTGGRFPGPAATRSRGGIGPGRRRGPPGTGAPSRLSGELVGGRAGRAHAIPVLGELERDVSLGAQLLRTRGDASAARGGEWSRSSSRRLAPQTLTCVPSARRASARARRARSRALSNRARPRAWSPRAASRRCGGCGAAAAASGSSAAPPSPRATLVPHVAFIARGSTRVSTPCVLSSTWSAQWSWRSRPSFSR